MSLLQWKPIYSVGLPSVDHEHRQLIDMINRVYAHIEESSDQQAIEACLEDICAGITAHFALEERHMRDAGYPEYAAHKTDHENLLDQIRDMMDVFAQDPDSGRAELESRLGAWFEVHFASFDARLHHRLGDHP